MKTLKINLLKTPTLFLLLLLLVSSCVVSKKKFEDEVAAKERLQKSLSDCQKSVAALKSDTSKLGNSLRDINKKLNQLNQDYQALNKRSLEQLESKQKSNEQLSTELRQRQNENNALAAQLKNREDLLAEKEKQLADREKIVQELQELLRKKDEAAKNLLAKVKNALSGFSSDELSVELKNGLVYVSLSDKLLFKSGRTDVDKKGQEALGKLAAELNKNPDIDITIEGHTDNVPIKTAQFADNWDLSVMRATSILRLLTKTYQVDSKRLTPAGKGEFYPVADNNTTEGKNRNRRTEIILSPKLDELYKLLEGK
jgi:chemotaxis protein MotB